MKVTVAADWESNFSCTQIRIGGLVGTVEPVSDGHSFEWVVVTDAWSGGFHASGEVATKEEAIAAAEAAIIAGFSGTVVQS